MTLYVLIRPSVLWRWFVS